MTYNNFMSALTLAYELYGVELDEEIYETYAFSAWRKIGNKYFRLYRTKLDLNCDPDGGWYVCKPCNLTDIEAITLDHEYAQETHVNSNHFGAITHPIEQEIEAKKKVKSDLYMSGQYVKYREIGDKIYFSEPYGSVNLLYKGIYADEDGYPYISDKEAEAIAIYCAYLEKQKQGIKSKDNGTLQISQMLKKDWLRACDLARVPESISQNEMNEILNVAASWNRHQYGQSTKPIW